MPNLSISIPHQYDRAEAKRRTQECVTQLRNQYGGTLGEVIESWTDDTMNFTLVALGMPISGKAHVEDRAVRVEIELPWLLSMLGGRIKESIEQQGRKLLGAR